MSSALLIRLQPAGPWRYGPDDGARDRVDSLYRSDRLFSAVSQAMLHLGHLDGWLAATARASHPGVVFSSLFPFQADTLFAPPPQTLWPPAVAALRTPSPVFLTKVRWRTAQFVPVPVIESLITGSQISADQWIADAESGCLLRRDRPQSSPFRTVMRARVPVDRLTNRSADGHTVACIEFEPGAGLWAVALFADIAAERAWSERIQAAFRLLGDIGFGGSRSIGWGQAPSPECQLGDWPALLFPRLARGLRNGASGNLSHLHWLLSLYTPAADDSVNWAEGKYALTVRGGRVESRAGWGAEKKLVRMVTEGSVVSSGASPKGQAVDVAPDRFAHPVYRAGFALALQLPIVHITEEAPQPALVEEVTGADVEVEPVELVPVVIEEADSVEREASEGEEPSFVEEAPIKELPTEGQSLGEVRPAQPVAESEPTVKAPLARELVTPDQGETTEPVDAAEPAAAAFESVGDVTPTAGSVAETPSAPPEATPARSKDTIEPIEKKATPETANHTSADEGKVADDEL
jgi:CRISPR type III-A-associated RAMP protein Csm4